jgi:hypothetical protein
MACGAKNPPKLPKIAETETISAVSGIPKGPDSCIFANVTLRMIPQKTRYPAPPNP